MTRCGKSFEKMSKEKMKDYLIELNVENILPCKRVYLIDWEPSKDLNALRQSLDELLRRTIDRSKKDGWTSIAYPAIGCGEFQCPADVVAQTLFKQLKKLLPNCSVKVSWIIHHDRQEIFNQFVKQYELILKEKSSPVAVQLDNQSTIEVIQGDLRTEQVSFSSRVEEALFCPESFL